MKRTLSLLVIGIWSLEMAACPAVLSAADKQRPMRTLIQAWGQPVGENEPIKCGLPVIAYAMSHRASLTPEALKALQQVLQRPESQTSVRAGPFRIHFDTVGVNVPTMVDAQGNQIPGSGMEFVDSTAAILNYSLFVETTVLGYPAPPADGIEGGGPEYDIYIQDLGSETLGSTYPDPQPPTGGRSPTYITIDNDFASSSIPAKERGLPALRVTIAHELHHAIQIGNYGFWDNDVYFYEMTSTWMEDVVYPSVKDYYNYLFNSRSQFYNPGRAFTSNDFIVYSRAVWNHYLAKRFGVELIRKCWEQIRGNRPLRAIDLALRSIGADFASAFAEWGKWNYFTGSRAKALRYYPDGADYPEMIQIPLQLYGPRTIGPTTLDVLGSTYYQLLYQLDSMTVILVNTDVESAIAGSPGAFAYTYDLQTRKIDESYTRTPIGLYGKLAVSNPATWTTWYAVGDSVIPLIDPSVLEEGRPFPSPFIADGNRRVYLPVVGSGQVQGQIYVYNAGMNLVYTSPNISATVLSGNRQVFSWDGKTSFNEVAPSGVYVFVVEMEDRRVIGKIALLKE